jgi:hypothetical protein
MTKLRVLVLSFPRFADIYTTWNPLVFPSHWEAEKNKQRPTKLVFPSHWEADKNKQRPTKDLNLGNNHLFDNGR